MRVVAAAVAMESGKVLLARRSPGQQLEGYWEFPGGKLDSGETVHQCVEREIREELELECTALETLTEHVHHYPGGVINLVAILVRLQGIPVLHVHDRIEWVALERLEQYLLSPADIPVAKLLIERFHHCE